MSNYSHCAGISIGAVYNNVVLLDVHLVIWLGCQYFNCYHLFSPTVGAWIGTRQQTLDHYIPTWISAGARAIGMC